jgi:hypothetical protein
MSQTSFELHKRLLIEPVAKEKGSVYVAKCRHFLMDQLDYLAMDALLTDEEVERALRQGAKPEDLSMNLV